MFSPSKDNIDDIYVSIHAYFKTEDDRVLKKYLGIESDRPPDGSIHLRQTYVIQRMINKTPGMENSSANLTHAVKPPIEKNEGAQMRKNELNYRPVIEYLSFLTNSTLPKEKSAVHQCA